MDIYNGNKLNRSMVWQTLYCPSLSFGRQRDSSLRFIRARMRVYG